MPWPQLLAGLRDTGYDGWLVLETEPTDDPAAAAAHNRRALQTMLAG